MAFTNGYSYRKLVTVDSTKVSGDTDLPNFPVLVNVTDARLRTVANGGAVQSSAGLDIRFELPNGTKLDHEVESWSATTGAIIAWVRIPTLTHASDTTFYLYYGNAAVVASEQNVPGVWDATYDSVYHMGELEPASLADSKGKYGTVSRQGTVTRTAGAIGNGQAFNSTYAKSSPIAFSLGAVAGFTADLWISRPVGTDASKPRMDYLNVQDAWNANLQQSGKIGFYGFGPNGDINNSGGYIFSTGAIPEGVLAKATITWDSTTVRFYINGVASGSFCAGQSRAGPKHIYFLHRHAALRHPDP